MAKKTSVGLVVLVDLPEVGRVAVLQRRGEFNHEKMGPESYPGACQVTAHGKVENDEDLIAALHREIREELGEIRNFFHDLQYDNFEEIVRDKSDDKLVVTFAVCLSDRFLRKVRLGPSSGGLRLLRQEEVDAIQDINGFDKKVGVIDRRVVAMFPDEKEAVRRAFGALR